jgi:spore germination protein YaaH
MLAGEGISKRARRLLGLGLGTLLVVAAAGSTSGPATAAGGPNQRGMSGWMPTWGNAANANASFAANIDLFEEISPFWYAAQGDPANIVVKGTAANLSRIRATAASRGVPVIPTITDGNGAGVMAGYLADPTLRGQHEDALVNLVVANGYAGIDLDYETFAFDDGRASWPALQPNWVTFVQELAGKLHAQGKQLHVTVPPIWLNAAGTAVDPGSYTVYAWSSIAGSVDGLRTMNYNWTSAGAGSPLFWTQRTIAYAQSIGFDMTKLQIGLPLYGNNGVSHVEGTCPPGTSTGTRSVTNANIDALIAQYGASPVRDATTGEMKFSYQESFLGDGITEPGPTEPDADVPTLGGIGTATATVGAVRLGACTITRTVWYLDGQALASRTALAVDAGAGIAVWAMGFDAGWTWDALRSQLAPQR